jgi:hypothetical protein
MRSILLTLSAGLGFTLLVGCGGGTPETHEVTPEAKAKLDSQHAAMSTKARANQDATKKP